MVRRNLKRSQPKSAPYGFHSILWEKADGEPKEETLEEPDFFHDLNLDQTVEAITEGCKDFDLKPFFYAPLSSVNAVTYRQEIMLDLEGNALMKAVKAFSQKMHSVRARLEGLEKLYKYEKEGWFLGAVGVYCGAIEGLRKELGKMNLKSSGMKDFHRYLFRYAESAAFKALASEARKLRDRLSQIRYSLLIQGDQVTVQREGSGVDYSAIIEEGFKNFRRGPVQDYRTRFPERLGMNHVEAWILERVAKLHPGVFEPMESFCSKNTGFMDGTVTRFDQEVQFYVSYLGFVAELRHAGLDFCYPQVSDRSKAVKVSGAFDPALGRILIREKRKVITNDFFLKGRERIFVVSGPNQGGKTTFARMFGQLHYLASLGCPVPGRKARLFLADRLLTHFEREETIETLRGKLQDDLIRMHGILDQATPKSIVILNEAFSSTELQDAVYLSRKVMERISRLDLLGVWVTFLTEMASFNPKTVSVVSRVEPRNPAVRTFKVERARAKGPVYALVLAGKYRLTYGQLKKRIKA